MQFPLKEDKVEKGSRSKPRHLLKGWIARDAECPMNDFILTNFGVYFTQTEMVFTLGDLPNVVFACTTDRARVPLEDARPLLNDQGAKLVLGG
jgi:hypothetical protein